MIAIDAEAGVQPPIVRAENLGDVLGREGEPVTVDDLNGLVVLDDVVAGDDLAGEEDAVGEQHRRDEDSSQKEGASERLGPADRPELGQRTTAPDVRYRSVGT